MAVSSMDKPFTIEDLARLRRMYENLRGTGNGEIARDRAALRRTIALLESPQAADWVIKS